MSESPRVTEAVYEPEDEELRKMIDRVEEGLVVDRQTTTTTELPTGERAAKDDCILMFEGDEVEGQVMAATDRHTIRLKGSLGLSSAAALVYARMLGMPTLAFTDRPRAEKATDEFLSVEWYEEEDGGEEKTKQRLGDSPIDLKREEIDLETLEHYARTWLSIDPE